MVKAKAIIKIMYLDNIWLHVTSSSAALKGKFISNVFPLVVSSNDLGRFFEETNKVKKILISG